MNNVNITLLKLQRFCGLNTPAESFGLTFTSYEIPHHSSWSAQNLSSHLETESNTTSLGLIYTKLQKRFQSTGKVNICLESSFAEVRAINIDKFCRFRSQTLESVASIYFPLIKFWARCCDRFPLLCLLCTPSIFLNLFSFSHSLQTHQDIKGIKKNPGIKFLSLKPQGWVDLKSTVSFTRPEHMVIGSFMCVKTSSALSTKTCEEY